MTRIQQHLDFAPKRGNRGSPALSLQPSPGKPTGSTYGRVKFHLITSTRTEAALVTEFRTESGSLQLAVTKNSNQAMTTLTMRSPTSPDLFHANRT